MGMKRKKCPVCGGQMTPEKLSWVCDHGNTEIRVPFPKKPTP